MKAARIILLGQSVYYTLTGIWPLVHMRSFEAITGSKDDDWLVKMVGLLAAAIGISLFIGRNNILRQTFALSITSAIAFLAVDTYYAVTEVISDIYLLDAIIQALIIVALCGIWLVRK